MPEGVRSLTMTLNGEKGYDLDLFARRGGFAFKGKPGVVYAANRSGAKERITLTAPQAGTWYIGVKCATTVASVQGKTSPVYTGNLGVLNGAGYSIKAEWDLKND